MPKINLVGKRFDRLTIVSKAYKGPRGNWYYECLCICGNTTYVSSDCFNGNTKSCGCLNIENAKEIGYKNTGKFKINFIGKKFGRLLVLKEVSKNKYVCKCDCNKDIILTHIKLRSGTKSCGCLIRDINNSRKPLISEEEKILRKNTRFSSEYKSWANKIKRIYKFTCVVCNYKGKKLVSHHLYNFADYPSLRLDINNGVCLCRKCHNDFHKLYGKHNTTKEMFDEFLESEKK